uniref:Uncharacterized protein n=1 Tax=Anguilla anguilla TaxID=7936 RepID=A0A0E9P5M4_ANGAN
MEPCALQIVSGIIYYNVGSLYFEALLIFEFIF